MHGLRILLGLALTGSMAAVGCSLTDNQVRPPTPPEEFRAPPDETRYTGPIQYPKETLDQDNILKKAASKNSNNSLMGGSRGPGRMPGQ